jgi:carbamoyl-phosphate synthase large subunit
MDTQAAGLYFGADVSYVIPRASAEDFFVALSRILVKEKIDVLIPTVDEEVAVLCREHVLSQLSQLTGFLLPPEEAATRALDKFLTVFEAKRAGLPVPETVAVPDMGDVDEKALDLPVVVKPSRSRGARGISYVERKGDLKRAWKKAAAEGGQVLFQEYVPGPVYTVATVFGRDKEIAASIVLKKTRELPPSGGVAVAGVTVADPKLQELGESYGKCLGWVGPASPEIKLDERDGSYKLMEVNPRLFGYNYLATAAGVNLSEVTARLALGQDIDPLRDYEEGVSFVRAPYDLVVREEAG